MTPLQLTFHGIDPSDAITEYVHKRAAKLENFADNITSMRVALEAPHRHQTHGNHYRVRIDVKVPGHELVVGRDPGDKRTNEDLYAAIDTAFDDAQRVLHDHSERQREGRRSRV